MNRPSPLSVFLLSTSYGTFQRFRTSLTWSSFNRSWRRMQKRWLIWRNQSSQACRSGKSARRNSWPTTQMKGWGSLLISAIRISWRSKWLRGWHSRKDIRWHWIKMLSRSRKSLHLLRKSWPASNWTGILKGPHSFFKTTLTLPTSLL